MIIMIVAVVLVIGLTTFLITLALRWFTGQVSAQLEQRFRDADTIVNDARIPDAWLKPRQPVGANRARCLRNLDVLIAFFEDGRFVDNPETRALLIDQLRRQRDRWRALDWNTISERRSG